MKYQVEYFKNQNMLEIHLGKRVTDERIINFWHQSHEVDAQPEYVKKIFKIDGITNVIVEQYSLTLEKATVFDWQSIIPGLIKIISDHFVPNDDMLEELPPIK